MPAAPASVTESVATSFNHLLMRTAAGSPPKALRTDGRGDPRPACNRPPAHHHQQPLPGARSPARLVVHTSSRPPARAPSACPANSPTSRLPNKSKSWQAFAGLPRGKTPRPAVARLNPPAAPAGENPSPWAAPAFAAVLPRGKPRNHQPLHPAAAPPPPWCSPNLISRLTPPTASPVS